MKYERVAVGKDLAVTRCARVFVDGIEVTKDCFETDDKAEYALCYCVPHRKTGAGTKESPITLESEVLVGRVEILLGPRESARRIRAAQAKSGDHQSNAPQTEPCVP